MMKVKSDSGEAPGLERPGEAPGLERPGEAPGLSQSNSAFNGMSDKINCSVHIIKVLLPLF